MPLVSTPYDAEVVGRILEMATPATPWHRRLWHSGPLMTAHELLEAGTLRGFAINAKRDLQSELIASLKHDVGLGIHANAIRAALPKDARDVVAGGHAWHSLELAADNADPGYLARWAAAIRVGHPPAAEFAARRIASHVLDHGWSQNHLHRWLTYRVVHRPASASLPDILDELEAEIRTPPKVFQICVPLAQSPPLPRPTPAGWLTAHQTAAWRLANIPSPGAVRQYGSVVFEVEAADAYAAAEITRARLMSLTARFSVGGRRHLRFGAEIWVAGRPDPMPLEGSPRRVEVRSFERLERLFEQQIPAELSSALELMAPLDRGTPAAATIGAWAAMEALLVGPADGPNSLAADRMALIVAASFIRAELTVLAWAHARSATDPLARAVASAADNRDKAEILERAIASGTALTLPRNSDQWAAARLSPLVPDANAGVRSLQTEFQRAFRRLYRQRNLISHGGHTSSAGLGPTIWLAAPLIGEGIDRINHAMLKRKVKPLTLAAGVKVRVETLRHATVAHGSGVVDLLE